MYTAINPYPQDAPLEVLKRVVQLPSATWGPASGIIAQIYPLADIVTTSFPHQQILGQITGVPGEHGMYRYLRCSFKITVRLNTTPYHQGTLVAYWMPAGSAVAQYTNKENITAWNSIILSASLQDQCTMHLPYFSARPHYDLEQQVNLAQQPVFYLAVLNPIISSSPSVTDSVPVNLFIQMEDINIYGILPQPVPSPLKRKNQERVYRGFKSEAKKDGEAVAKDLTGLAAKGALALVKPVIKTIPFAPQLISVGKFLFNNLDKPTTTQNVTFTTERTHRAHTMLRGEDFSEMMAQEPTVNVARDVQMTSSDMAVTQYAQKPNLYYTRSITTPGVVMAIGAHPMIYANTVRTEPDFLAFASSFYQYWRGGIKFLIHFVGTPFYSARFKISVSHAKLDPGASDASGGTGFYSKIVDVKGDAWTTVTVPYLLPTVWATMFDQSKVSWLVIELITPIMGSSLPADAKYYVNIFRAAANDFQLAQLTKAGNFTAPGSGVYHGFRSESVLDQKFAEETEGITVENTAFTEHGLFMADQSTSISDATKRFVSHTPLPGGLYSYPSVLPASPYIFSPLHLWGFGFCFWRGSRRLKLGASMRIAKMFGVDGFTSTSGHANAISYADNTTGADMFTVPWYSIDAFIATPTLNTTIWIGKAADGQPVDTGTLSVFLAAGDDFTYLMPQPPLINILLFEHMNKKQDVLVPKAQIDLVSTVTHTPHHNNVIKFT